MKIAIFTLTLLFITPMSIAAQYISVEEDKLAIFEIVQPTLQVGTGFVIRDSLLGSVMVTCKHVIQDSAGEYYDKVLVRRNKMLKTKQVISDTNSFYLFLKSPDKAQNEREFFYPHPDADIDLVVIPLYYLNKSLNKFKPIKHFGPELLLSKEGLAEKGINEGTDVEIIGFSLSSSFFMDRIHYHISRFGKVALFTTEDFQLSINGQIQTANYMLLDISARLGDSGSPILAHIGDKRYIIGMITALSPDIQYAIGYPSYYIYDLLHSIHQEYLTSRK